MILLLYHRFIIFTMPILPDYSMRVAAQGRMYLRRILHIAADGDGIAADRVRDAVSQRAAAIPLFPRALHRSNGA